MASFAINRSLRSRTLKQSCTSLMVMARRTGFFASFGVNSSRAELRSTCPSATAISKICFRSTQMIDDRERQTLGLQVQQILKFITLQATKLPIRESAHKMNRYPVHVIFPRRVLPLPAVIGKVDLLDELAKLPDLVRLSLGVFLCDDGLDRFPSLCFGHLLDKPEHTATAFAI